MHRGLLHCRRILRIGVGAAPAQLAWRAASSYCWPPWRGRAEVRLDLENDLCPRTAFLPVLTAAAAGTPIAQVMKPHLTIEHLVRPTPEAILSERSGAPLHFIGHSPVDLPARMHCPRRPCRHDDCADAGLRS